MDRQCEEKNRLMLEYMDGGLEDRERRAFESHLAECETCRTGLLEHREAWKLLDHYTAGAPSERFVAGTLKTLQARRSTLRRRWIRRAAVGLAAVLLLAATLFFKGFPLSRSVTEGEPEGEGKRGIVEAELLENLELIEDLEFLEEYGEELELAMEYDLYEILNEGEGM